MHPVPPAGSPLDAAELTALAHLYRGENSRATAWRCRLDATTNWAVVTTGLGFSATFSNAAAPPWPLLMLAAFLTLFMGIEARRYRYFDLWRTRIRVLERCVFVPLLRRTPAPAEWGEVIADDYERPRFHLSIWEALGHRVRHNYGGLFALEAVGYVGKLTLHPTLARDASDFVRRADFGPVPGAWVLAGMALFHGALLGLALVTRRVAHTDPRALSKDDAMVTLARAAGGARSTAEFAHHDSQYSP